MTFTKTEDFGVSETVLEYIELAIHKIIDTNVVRDFFIKSIVPTEPNVYIVTYRVIGRIDPTTATIRISRRTF